MVCSWMQCLSLVDALMLCMSSGICYHCTDCLVLVLVLGMQKFLFLVVYGPEKVHHRLQCGAVGFG